MAKIAHDEYKVVITLTENMLGTNPIDPNIFDTHILNKQRELILEKSKINKEVNKYLDQLPLAKNSTDKEITALMDKLEELFGIELDAKKRAQLLAEGLDALKETLAEHELKGVTLFFWNKDKKLPMIGSHMIYGFLKAASEAIGRTMDRKNATALQSTSYTQSLINQHVKIEGKFITFDRDIQRSKSGDAYFYQRPLRAMTAQGPRVSLAKSEVVPSGAKLEFTLKVMSGSAITEDVLDTLFNYGEWVGLGQWRSAGNGQFSFTMKKVLKSSGGVKKSKSEERRLEA